MSDFLKQKAAFAVEALIIAIAYFVTAKIGLNFATIHPSATALWAPTGIAIASVLIFGPRVALSIFVGAFFANITTAGNIATSVAIASGNTLEALIAVGLAERFTGGRQTFYEGKKILKYALLAGVMSTAVSATVGVGAMTLEGFANPSQFIIIWLSWWLGDLGGALVVAPLIVLYWNEPGFVFSFRKFSSVVLLYVGLFVITLFVFGSPLVWDVGFDMDTLGIPATFIIMPVMLLIAINLGLRETAAAVLLVSATATVETFFGRGPFVLGGLENLSLVILQLYNGVLAVTFLSVAATMRQKDELVAVLEDMRRSLQKENYGKDESIATLAHELRNMLAPVLAWAELLLTAPMSEKEKQEAVRGIMSQINKWKRLLDDIMDAFRISHGQLELKMSRVDIRELIVYVVETLQDESIKRRIDLKLNLPRKKLLIKADRLRFEQIITNLLSNALKYTPEQGVVLISAYRPGDNGRLVIEVSNTGPSISDEDLVQVFADDNIWDKVK
jgi:signal transduction histidine kinase